MIEEDIQVNSTSREIKRSKKVKKLLQNLKNIIMANNNFENLHLYLSDFCNSSPQPDEIRNLDKMIRTICIRLKSALQMVDQFLSTHYIQDIFSQEKFEKCLINIQKLMKRNEINDWISNIKKFIESTKKGNSAISLTKDKRQERNFLESISEYTKFKKKEQPLVANHKQSKNNQEQKSFSFEATKEQIKQRFTRTQLPPKKYCNQPISKGNSLKQDVYSEKPKILNSLNTAEVRQNKEAQEIIQKNILKFETKDTSSIVQEYKSKQNWEEMRQSVDEQILNQFQSIQILDRARQVVDENDSKLMKTIFAIKNAKNLNFLKKVLWEECKFKIRNAEQLYSSYQMEDFNLSQNEFKGKNILLLVQFVNGIVVGGFKRQEKYIETQRHRGFLFSLSKQEAFAILQGNKQQQLLRLNGNEIIFGKDELKINHAESTVSSNFGIGKGVFDSNRKDVDYLIGENSRKIVEIYEFAIYQII